MVQTNLAFTLSFAMVIPAVFYILYRSILPYEPVMRDLKLAGALMFPFLLGAALGVFHILADVGFIETGYAGLAFLLVYPLVASLMVVVVFNRRFFMKQAVAPVYFGIGGAGLAMGLGGSEVFRALAAPASQPSDAALMLSMFVLATSFILVHTSKGLFLGVHYASSRRARGLFLASAMEAPLGLLYLIGLLNVERTLTLALMLLYGVGLHYWTWQVFFPSNMSQDLAKDLTRERRRIRRRHQLGKAP